MKVPHYVMEHFRDKTDTMICLKEDIRSGNFSEDDIWYATIIEGTEEVRDWNFLGFTESQYNDLIKYFEEYPLKDKSLICQTKYDGFMTDKDKAIESLMDFYNAIYDRFLKKLNAFK